MLKRVISFLLGTCLVFTMVFPTFAASVEEEDNSLKYGASSSKLSSFQTSRASEYDADTAWQAIREVVERYEQSGNNIHRWSAISATTANPSSDTMPATALLGNGHVGVTSKNTTTEKAYILSSSDFASDNTRAWGYSHRSPQIAIGGELVIGGKQSTDTTAFSEYQNILDAEIFTQRELGGIPVEITTWIAPFDDILVTEIISKGGSVLPLEIKPKGNANRTNYIPVHAGSDGDVVWGSRSTNINPEMYEGENTPARWVSEFVIASKVLGGSNHSYSSDATQGLLGVDIAPGETIYVVTAAHTEAAQPVASTVGSGGAGVSTAVESLSPYTTVETIKALKEENRDWWKDFYTLSWVDFADNALNRTYYDSQYIFGSSSRDGAVASGLYGVWITHDAVKWQGDYHLNYNMQAPYYGAYSSNRLNNLQPQFDVYVNWMDEGIGIASDYTRLRGIMNWYVDSRPELSEGIPDAVLYPVGFREPIKSGYGPSHGQTINALFCASQIIAYYRYSQDLDWLLTKQETWEGNWYSPYDFLAKTANFYESWVEKRGPREFTEAEIATGYYEKNSINNVTSGDKNSNPTQLTFTANYGRYPIYNEADHGNDYVYIVVDSAHEGGFELNPTVTVGNLQNLLKCLIEIGDDVAQSYDGTYAPTGLEVEGIYKDKYAIWQDLSEHMADYMQGAIYPYEGRNTAYKDREIFGLSEDRWIRHLSATVNLEFIHPGYELGFDSDPKLLEIARTSVLVMGYAASPGWNSVNNTPKIFTQGARVGYDTKDLIAKIKSSVTGKMNSNGHVYDATHGWEKSGITEALNTLLVAESGGIIKVFPYWNDRNAQFSDIRMPGAFLVSSSSKKGDVSRVDVTSEKDGVLNLVIPWDNELWDYKVFDLLGQEVEILGEYDTQNSGDRYISINATAGGSYSFVRIPDEDAEPFQPIELIYSEITPTSIGLEWQANPDETDAVGYEVRYFPENQPANIEIERTENTSLLIEGLEPDTNYTFIVYSFYKYSPDVYSRDGASINVPTAPQDSTVDTVLMVPTLHFEIADIALSDADEGKVTEKLPAVVSALVYDATAKRTVPKDLIVNWDVSSIKYDTTHPQVVKGTFSPENQVENPYNYQLTTSLRFHTSTVEFVDSQKQTLNSTFDIGALENVVDWNMVHHSEDDTMKTSHMEDKNLIENIFCNNEATSTSPDFWVPISFDNGIDPVVLNELDLGKGNAQGRGAAHYVRGVGSYYEFEVDAQPFEQELIVIVGGNRSVGELTASFDTNQITASGGSMATNVAQYKVTSMTAGAHNNNKGGQTYVIRFASSEIGQKLRVRFELITDLAPSNGQIMIKGSVLRQVGTPQVEISDLLENGQITFFPLNPAEGDEVTVVVTPDADYQYVDQSLSLNGVSLSKNGQDEFSFVMPYGAAVLSADFRQLIQSVNVTVSGGGESKIDTDGGTLILNAEVVPSEANQGVTWRVESGSEYASVSDAGVVTATADGTAVVRATSTENTAIHGEIAVVISGQDDVPPITPTSVTITVSGGGESKIDIDGGTLTLNAEVVPSEANQGVTWRVESGSEYASVSDAGVVTATADGTAVVRATSTENTAIHGEIAVVISGQDDVPPPVDPPIVDPPVVDPPIVDPPVVDPPVVDPPVGPKPPSLVVVEPSGRRPSIGTSTPDHSPNIIQNKAGEGSLSSSDAKSTFEKAVLNLPQNANKIVAKFSGKTSITKSVVAELQKMAAEKNLPLQILLNAVENNKVVTRIAISSPLTKSEISTTIALSSSKTASVKAILEKYGDSALLVDFAQPTEFGGLVKVYLKLPIELLGKTLVFSRYNPITKLYVVEEIPYTVDANGYVVFETNSTENLIIGEKKAA